MTLIHSMNDNILIPHPSILDAYQDEAKTRAIQGEKSCIWVGTKPKI